MKIAAITLHHVRMPLIHPFTTSFGTLRVRELILVEATDADGVVGWGESTAFAEPSYNEETLKGNWHILADYLIPLLDDGRVGHPSELSGRFRPIRGNRMAKAALETALWDLYAKREGIPLARAIGGTKTHVDVGVSIGLRNAMEDLLEAIRRNLEAGYKRIKLKIEPGRDVALEAGVRKHFPDVPLMVDANSAYTLKDADVLAELDRFRLMMIEQPLAHDDYVDHAELQKRIRTPICLDESIHSAEDARKAIGLGGCRIVNVKLGRVGGFAESIRLHDLCLSRGVPVWCGGMLESGVGRAHNIALASLPGFTLPGDTAASSNYWDEDIIDPPVTVENGQIRVPDGPGIGFEVNRERLARRTLPREPFRIG